MARGWYASRHWRALRVGEVLLLLLPLLLAAPAPARAADGDAPPPWRVVLIRSWDSLFPINVARETAMREAIVERSPRAVEFFPEEIDPLRFPETIEPDFVRLLQRKYRDTPIDLVIASGIEPLQFVARYRDTIWPGARTVFNGVFEGSLDNWQRPPRTAGITVPLDIAGTLALGRALAPDARKLMVVSGAAPFDESLRELAERKLREADTPLAVHDIRGLSRAETAARVASLGPDSIVLYLSMLRDGTGQLSGAGALSMSEITAHSRVPVLSVVQTQFRRGPVGGSAPRIDAHGRAAGRLARQVLEGADPGQIEVRSLPQPMCEVDWSALQRWRIAPERVPSGCRIANRPASLWEAYLWPLLGLLAIIGVQLLLISALVIQSRRRRQAEGELQARGAEIAQVSRLSMIGALTAGIAHEINQPMGAILSNAEAALMMLDQGSLDATRLRDILEDIRNEDLRASEVIRSLRRLLARSEWKPVPLEVNTEVADALRHLAFDAARRGVRIAPIFGAQVPAVMSVPVHLQQVVINLAMNAMDAVASYPPKMREVRIETRGRSDGAEVVVADHGPGLTPEEAARVFSASFTTKKDGMGFGLSIVNSLVQAHRGRVWFEPNVPHGAVFHVWLPAVGS